MSNLSGNTIYFSNNEGQKEGKTNPYLKLERDCALSVKE